MPSISIVIPVYNGAATLAQTLRSALRQTFTDFEVLVVDDGSTDETPEIARSTRDPRVRVIARPHRGLAATRNHGIAEARAPLIAFLDADDLWTADKLEREYQRLQEWPEAALCYSWTCYISQENELLGAQQPLHHEGNVLPTLLVRNLLHCGSNALVRKPALEEIGGFREDVVSAEDWDCWLRLAEKHPFALVPAYQVLYRQRTNGTSTELRGAERSNLQVLERALARAPGPLQGYRRAALASLHRYFAALHAVRRSDWPRGLAAVKHLARAAAIQPALLLQVPTYYTVASLLLLMFAPWVHTRVLRPRRQRLLARMPSMEKVRQALLV